MRNSSASSPVSEIPLRALAELELRKRRRARVNLYEFVPRISPTYSPPVHLDPLVQALERSWAEPVKRTCHAPPRHGKTDTLLAFIALSLLRHPERTLGFISYEADVAKSKSRKARLWAEASGVTLAEDSRKLNEWRTREGGGLLAGGVGGPLTGHGLNCFVGGTLVATEAGNMPIEALCALPIKPRVLSLNHESGELVWGQVVATRSSIASELVDVVTTSGRRVRCTANHRFFVRGVGYREASLLQPGYGLAVVPVQEPQALCRVPGAEARARAPMSSVLSERAKPSGSVRMRMVQEGRHEAEIPCGEGQRERLHRPILQQRMSLCASSHQERSRVSCMQYAHAEPTRETVLLGGLSRDYSETQSLTREALPEVPSSVYAKDWYHRVLLDEVQERGSFWTYDGKWQQPIYQRQKLREAVSRDARVHFREGRAALRGVPDAGHGQEVRTAWSGADEAEPSTTPHRQRRDEQLPNEPCDALRELSRDAPSFVEDSVAMVERVCDSGVEVYDIQVERYHNFFAGEILVHNCIIIDDPYKNRVQAESAAYRAMVTDWWNDVAETRIEPGGSAFICHTRWHHDDLIGHVHGGEDSATWEHINLMALGPGKVPLWPERWDAEALEAKRKAVGEYTWASLYQGHPRPRGGAVFEGDVVSYQRLPDSGLTFSIGLDLAYSERTSSDYSVAVVMARAGNDYFVVDVVRAQVPAPSFAARVRALLLKYPTAQVRWYAAGTEMAAAQFFRKEGIPMSALNPKGDKFTRAMPLAAAWNRGSVLLPSYSVPWAEDLVAEIKSFTGVRDLHDDQVDALAAAFDLLEAPRAPVRGGTVATSDFESNSIG